MGQRDIRRLLIIGAMTVVRWAVRKGAAKGSWLARMLAAKPRLVAAIALANKMTRSVWAMLSKGEDYRGSALAAGLISRRLRRCVGDQGGRGAVRANRSDRSRPGKAIRVNELSARGFDLRLVCVSPYRPRHVAKPHFEA